MRILVITQYFWPENFRVNDLCLELKNRGHEVSILTGKPNYPNGIFFNGYSLFSRRTDYWNDLKIYRVPLLPRGNGSGVNLFFNYLSFTFFSCLRILFIKDKFDKIIVYQLSPGTIGFPALVAKTKFKAKLFFYIQDLWPESLSDAGGINSSLILQLVDQMMNFFYKESHHILVQSNSFIPFLIEKGVDQNKIKYLPNTVEEFYHPVQVLDEYLNKLPIGFNIIFAGNIGFAQDFDTILKTANILRGKNVMINWIIIGDGRARIQLQQQIKELSLSNFYFLGSYKSTIMPYFFACADLLLVSLKKSQIFSLTIPSKIQSYLACKKPLIGNLDGAGSLIIKESNCGKCSESGDFTNLANNIEFMYNISKKERDNYGINGYNYYLKHFHRNVVYDKLEYYLNLEY
jgi:glycosyltransferase involved in cell wall biosynthesis